MSKIKLSHIVQFIKHPIFPIVCNIIPLIFLNADWKEYIFIVLLSIVIFFPIASEAVTFVIWTTNYNEFTQITTNTKSLILSILFIIVFVCRFANLYIILTDIEKIKDKTYICEKNIIITLIATLIFSILLSYGINSLFFQCQEEQYGAYTTCYTNNLSKEYHNSSCKVLNDTPILTTIKTAINDSYERCQYCTVDHALNNICYVTDTGSCYHSRNCGYLRSVYPITVYDALKCGYRSCSGCYVTTNAHKSCYITRLGKYFHTQSCPHLKSTELSIKETNVNAAIKDEFDACDDCSVGELDISYLTKNNYILSSLISVGIAFIILISLNIYIIKRKNK